MDRTSTTTTGYDIWNEIPKPENNQTSTNGGRYFKPQVNNQIPTNGGRHFEPQSSYPTPTNGGRHFKPQKDNQIFTNRGRHFKPQGENQTPTNGGDTSNPKTPILMIQPKLPTSQEGETLQTPAFGN